MNLAAQNEGLKWYNDKKKQACRYSKITNVLGVTAGIAVGAGASLIAYCDDVAIPAALCVSVGVACAVCAKINLDKSRKKLQDALTIDTLLAQGLIEYEEMRAQMHAEMCAHNVEGTMICAKNNENDREM